MQQKQFRMGFLCFLKKEQKPVSFQKKQKKNEFERRGGLEFFEENVFFSTLTIFQSFFGIFPWSHDLEQLTPLSVWLGVRRTLRVKDHYNEADNYWHLNT